MSAEPEKSAPKTDCKIFTELTDCRVFRKELKCPCDCPNLNVQKQKYLKRKDKRARIFHRLMTGLQIAKNMQNAMSYMRFMTLTGTPNPPRPIKESFDILRQRIERAEWYKDGFDGFKFNRYFCLRTKEGPTGVLHVIFWGGNYIPQKWLSWNWELIHHAFKADIRACWTNRKKVNGLVGYLLPYLTDQQPIDRMSYGWKWAWLGFCKSWTNVKQKMGLLRRSGDLKMQPKWNIELTKPRSTEKYTVQIMSPHDRYYDAKKDYWRVLMHYPLPTTRKTSFCNVDHSIWNRKYYF